MNNRNYPFYDVKRITSLRQLVDFRAEESGDKVAFAYGQKEGGKAEVTYRQFQEQTQALGTAFFDLGIQDTHAAILGENSYHWLLAFFSIIGGGNVAVPIDKELSADAAAEILKDSACSVLIYADTYADIARQIEKSLPVRLVSMGEFPALIEKGRALIHNGDTRYANSGVDEERLAVLIYTSGTTGKSKGVMLSQRNFALDTYSACCNARFDGDTLLLLPLHHTFGLLAGVFVTMLYGYTVYINTSLKELAADLRRAKPKYLFLVPLFVEMLYKNICATALQQGGSKEQQAASVQETFGGRLDAIICGGAALHPKYVQGFRAFGIKILNGYGITECSPVVAVNRNDFYKDGSVGMVLNECTVRIEHPDADGNGEICVKGSMVMQGYYHMDAETQEALQDGWFHTGDLGHMDEDHFLYITGRKKNLIILGNGENVAPEELETMVQDIPLVREVVVYEKDGRVVAEIYPDMEYAKAEGIQDVENTLRESIAQLNRTLPKFKQIGGLVMRGTEFEKTATKKIKRDRIGD